MNDIERLAQFDHHPDPAIDFCVEVEAIINELDNHRNGFLNGTPSFDELMVRAERAMEFRVGGDTNAVLAKQDLREALAAEAAQPPAQESQS